MPKRRDTIVVLATAALVAPSRGRTQERLHLRAGGASNDVIKPLYYAARSGSFARYDLTVDILPMNNGAASAAALIGGDLDVASVSILTPLQAHQKGIPMRILAPSLWNTSDAATVFTVVPKDSPLRSGRDLNGKTVGVPGLADISTVGIFAWIDQSGGDAKSVRVIEVPASAAVAMLEQGRADAVTMIEPFVSAAVATGKVRILTQPLAAISKRFEGAAYVVMEPAVEKNLDAMQRLARGLHEAIVYTNAHLPETVALVSSYSGALPDVVAKMHRVTDPEFVDMQNIQPVIDVLARYGAIDKAFPAADIISAAALRPPR
jgi:NitT/TauT family transport system substrate-binding protein